MLLGTFMGGMCLGSYLLPRYIGIGRAIRCACTPGSRSASACAACCCCSACRWSAACYGAIGGGNIFVRGVVAAICLLPPTLLMGATLPAIARYVETTPQGVSWLGYFYGGNIAGAVLGAVLAGFYLLRVYDMAEATYVAVALNAGVGALALLAGNARGLHARRAVVDEPTSPAAAHGPDAAHGRLRRHRAVGRHRARLPGGLDAPAVAAASAPPTYTFSLILARVPVRPGHRQQRRGGAGAQHHAAARGARLVPAGAVPGHGVGGVHAATDVAAVLADQPVDLLAAESAIWFNFQLDLVRCLWVVLPGAILWGASFPAGAGRGGAAADRTWAAWWAASTPPTPWAPSSARWSPAW